MTALDDLDAWEAALVPAVEKAITEWAATIGPKVLPTLTAAGELPPDLGSGEDDPSWRDAFNKYVLPVLAGLMAGRAWRWLSERGTTPAAPPAAPAAPAASTVVPYPTDWVAGLTDTQRSELVTEFRQLSDMLGDLLPDQARIIIEYPSWTDHVGEHLSTVSNRVVGMPDEVFSQISTRLDKAIADGASPDELRDLVQEVLTDTGHDRIIPNRASVIARTETTAAYNSSALEAALIEQAETGETLEKTWACAIDGRTRDTHFAADGQRVPLDGAFEVGGYRMRFPGDPAAPVWLTANCRCTTIVLAADEATPGEAGRQTEPGGQSRHRDGSQADEIARREAEGVTRAREDPAGIGITAAGQETSMRRRYSGVLAPIGKPTGDGRQIAADSQIAFRDFPLPLMWQKSTSEGHDQSVIVGRIDTAHVEGGEIVAEGVLFESSEADEAAQLLADEVIRPSVDLCDMVADFLLLDAGGEVLDVDADGVPDGDPDSELMLVREATVMAATLVAKPAFAEAKLVLTEAVADEGADAAALTASVAKPAPAVDAAVFADPALDGPTALTVQDGLVFGHLALWGSCHVGMGDRCVTPPRSGADYAHFHTSTIDTEGGPVSVGRLTVDTGHADARAAAHTAAAHYDNTGACWALVRAGEDQHGIWVAGVLNPDASEATTRAGASAPLSGDWRSIGGNLELVAALSVNTPGFPVPRTYANSRGAEMSLVAAGAVQPSARHRLDAGQVQAVAEAAVDAYVSRQSRATEAAMIRDRHAAAEAARLTARHRKGA